ncbi:ankyrin repeat-containing domain protein [Aspergillus pseudoustus]|uniref:Ankyrin repeat-containing domain protein n=1 Tax=Aspergillus pseudoustus TaxID=1810923 RepID=A0ABR4J4E6_9EURO
MLINQTNIDVNTRSPEHWTLLATAARDNDCDMIRVLLGGHENLDVNAEVHGRPALLWAWESEHLDAVKILIGDPRVDVNAKSNDVSPILHSAIENDVLDIAWLILETRVANIDVNLPGSMDETPLHKAIAGNHTEIARRI